MKSGKGNCINTLDRRLYDNAIREIISDTCKFEELNENPTFKPKVSLQRF